METVKINRSPDADQSSGGSEVSSAMAAQKQDQLNKINTALADFGSELEYLKPPEFQPEYESLRGKKVVMVDDVFGVIENILPEIVVATDGNARGIHYKGQSLQELAADILSKKPDVIILDYHLSDYLKGIEVAKELSKIGFTGKIVGCSSEGDRAKEFIKYGAVGNIDKTSYPASDAIKNLARMVA